MGLQSGAAVGGCSRSFFGASRHCHGNGGPSFAEPYIEGGSSFSAFSAIGIISAQKAFLFFSASFSIAS